VQIHPQAAGGGEIVGEAGEEFLQHFASLGQHEVGVQALRYALARAAHGQPVTVDHRHPVEGLAQRSCREQTSDARAEHDRVPGVVCWFHGGQPTNESRASERRRTQNQPAMPKISNSHSE
jgi:hypothetical protein